jgi:hypothetical protein
MGLQGLSYDRAFAKKILLKDIPTCWRSKHSVINFGKHRINDKKSPMW